MIKKILIVFLAVISLQNAGLAQDNKDQRTIPTRIADLLAQMPANDTKQFKNNNTEIAQLGEDGYITLIINLVAPGKGNNAALEYAIGGFTAYVSQTNQHKLKQMAVNAYTKALTKLTDNDNKSFIISQLEIIGSDDAVVALQPYLTDANLADQASRAMVKINTNSAKLALLNALPKANGNAKLSIIGALGDSKAQEAINEINQLAINNDENTRKVALYALAYIASPSSEEILANAAAKVGYQFENTNATANYLIYATELLKNGANALADRIAKKLLAVCVSDDLVHTRIAALKIIVDANKNNNQEILLAAASDKNITYRTAALKLAGPYLDANNTGAWLNQLNKATDEVKIDIMYMLGANNVKTALPSLTKLFSTKNQQVKFAALNAATTIGQQQILPNLLKVMHKGDSLTINTGTKLIDRMSGSNVAEMVAAAIPTAKPNLQIALLRVLGARAANAQINIIYDLLKSKNTEVQLTAYQTLSSVVVKANLPELFTLLNLTIGEQELAVQAAIIAAVKNNENNTAQVDAVLSQMAIASPNKKMLYYQILANLGGNKALNAVTEAFNTGDEKTQEASLMALAAFNDKNAAAALIKIARDTKNTTFLNTALQGYLRAIRASSAPAEQKLLMLRNAMEVAQSITQKIQIIKASEQAKCLNAIFFAGQYLNDVNLQQTAANAVMNITMAGQYEGDLIKNLLNQTIAVITGPDSGYQKEGMRKYISSMKEGAGFVSIFNGNDLAGWKGLVENPIKRAKMDAKTLAEAQIKADTAMAQSWKVINGELHFIGKGDNIATVKNYGDFEMLVDWKIINDKKGEGDAGIYLRGTPQVQIWDNARTNVGAQVGSGGLYNNQVNPSKPLTVADNPLDEWNTFRILMIGDRVTVYLNGVLVTDNVILENYWNRNMAIFASEQIELQAHGSPVAYRDIYIKELTPVKPFELSAQEIKEGYQILFDGTNMYNWKGNTTDYTIVDGTIAILPKPGKGSGGNLFTKAEFSDFIFRFEFKLTPGANNGLGIRAPLLGDAAYEGMELQILDNEAPIYKDLKAYQYHGSIYGTVPAKRGFLKPVGEWNYQEVIVKGSKITVILNGTTILDADISDARKNGTMDGLAHPGLLRNSGHIGFLGHGSPVQFKNIRIKDLSTPKK